MSRPRGVPFVKGVSGNPGGRPKSAGVRELARRYVVDAMDALVWTARLRDPRYAAAARAAADSIIDLADPEARKAGLGAGDAVDLLHMHLLAVKAVEGACQAPQEPDPEGLPPELIDGAIEDGFLPAPATELPHETLPLWDLAKAKSAGNAD